MNAATGTTRRALVIGAGIIGLTLAWRLQSRGFTVTVLDPDPPGQGASFGNAGSISASSVVPLAMPGVLRKAPGMLLDPEGALHVPPGYWLRAMPWLLRFAAAARPASVARISAAMGMLHRLAVEQHMAIAREIGAPDLIRTNGSLYLYRDAAALAKDATDWRMRAEVGTRIEALDRDGITALEPAISPAYTVARFLPDHAHCANPHRYCTALAEALTRAGGRIIRDRAHRLVADGGRITSVMGEQTSHIADEVVIAAGAWSAELLKPLGYRIPLETQRGYHVEVPSAGAAISRCVVPSDRKVFLTPMETGLRVAGTVEFGGLARPPTPARAELLYRDLRSVLPDVDTSGSSGFWMGHRPCLPDSLPVIGAAPRHGGLWFAFGHGHLGLTAAAPTAELLAKAMVGPTGNTDLREYSVARFD